MSPKRLYIAGHTGMVGRALMRALQGHDVITAPHAALDLRDQSATYDFIATHKPDAIIMAAATVGGIGDNAARPGDYLFDNMVMAANIIHGAHINNIPRLLYLGSSCIYPRAAAQPITPEALLTAPLEPTNEAYALAKIAGVKLCQSYRAQYGRAYIAAMPCNLYGPYDRFDAARSHVIPALMLKMHAARLQGAPIVTLWGTGTPLREFLHVDDLARALLLALAVYDEEAPLNVGSGVELSIQALAHLMAEIAGYQGQILFNPAQPDGVRRKVLDSRVIKALGWQADIDLRAGLQDTYRWYCQNERVIHCAV